MAFGTVKFGLKLMMSSTAKVLENNCSLKLVIKIQARLILPFINWQNKLSRHFSA